MASHEPAWSRGRPRPVARAVRQIQDGYGLTLVLTILTVACLAATGVGTGGGLLAVDADRGDPPVRAEHVTRPSPGDADGADPRRRRHRRVGPRPAHRRHPASQVAAGAIGFAIAAVVPVVIMRRIARSDQITYRLVIGALVVYLLLGLCYAYVFGTHRPADRSALLRPDRVADHGELPVLQLHHAEHRRVWRLQRRHHARPDDRHLRGAVRPALPRVDRGHPRREHRAVVPGGQGGVGARRRRRRQAAAPAAPGHAPPPPGGEPRPGQRRASERPSSRRYSGSATPRQAGPIRLRKRSTRASWETANRSIAVC